MVWFILAGIITLVLAFKAAADAYTFLGAMWDWLCGILIFGGVSVVIAMIMASALGHITSTRTLYSESTHTTQLISFNDKGFSEGGFSLGFGAVNGKWYYLYYHKIGNEVKFGKILAKNARVFEEKRKNAILHVHTHTPKKTKWTWHSMDSGIDTKEYHFHIPENTVKRDFRLDLE